MRSSIAALADLVVAAGGAALGDPDGRDLGHDLLDGVGVRLDRRGQVRVADRAVADAQDLGASRRRGAG